MKLWIQLGAHVGEWLSYLQDRPATVARTLISIAVLAVTVALVTRFRSSVAFEDAKERLLYGSGVALSLSYIATILVVGAGIFAIAQLNFDGIPGFVNSFPKDELRDYGQPVLAAAAIVVGVWLMRKNRRRPMDLELGSGLIVVGAWTLPTFLLNLTDLNLGFNNALADIFITLALALVLATRWKSIDTPAAVTLSAITVFSWMVMTKGDWISVAGGIFGFPAVLIVVVGIVFSLAGDAGFTAESSKRLPQGSRVLMFVGYLILSVSILNWVEVTHSGSGSSSGADAGFFFLGIPWAAWLVGRRLLRLGETDIEEEVAGA